MNRDPIPKPWDLLYERLDDYGPETWYRAFYAGSPQGISGYGRSHIEAEEDLREMEKEYAMDQQTKVEDGYYEERRT